MDKMILGRYLKLDSWIHHLDPRTKLLASFYFILIVFLANNLATYVALTGFMVLAVVLSKVPLGFFLKGVRPLILLILVTVAFQVFFMRGGQVYFHQGPIMITQAGVIGGAFIFARLVLIIFMSTLLTLTTAPLELTDGIEHLFQPLTRFGFPAHEIALMLAIALRYVPTLMDEAGKIMNAQRSRGVEFDQGSLMQRMKSIIPILVPLFISAFNRAEEMALAMEARGYRGAQGRTKYRQLTLTRQDLFAWLGLVVLTGILLYLRQF
ncbi:energy-coupling factor transporter transmembrane component T family protein [Vaginisenegalia massiliensis]|uniref:energy-coupling factor transporter transmembrane component T family protein n=1 Tax=Vaginisenegalia massiliensis TaxID=2058294 RepID=UPI000F53E049|nr:energy-coupling factor transporter transmembrane component T [Vaginisenegalia massiliensis]